MPGTRDQPPVGPTAATPEPTPGPRGCRRWLRRGLLSIAALLAVLTVAAGVFDLATSGYSKPARALYPGPMVQVGNRLVAYRAWGTRGSPIILLGGAAEPTWVWHEVGPQLASRHHRVFAIDLPPWGYTQRGGPYTMAAWLGLLHGFEQRLGIQGPLLVGHSLGAGVVAAEARTNPTATSGIVLLDGDALAFGGGGLLAKLWVFPFNPALMRLIAGSDWAIGGILRSAWGPHPPPLHHATIDEFKRPFRVDGTAAALRQLAAHQLPGLTLEELRDIRVPRAVVWGAEDDVDPVSAGRATARALGVPIQLLPGVGHLSLLADPGAVAAAIEGLSRAGHVRKR